VTRLPLRSDDQTRIGRPIELGALASSVTFDIGSSRVVSAGSSGLGSRANLAHADCRLDSAAITAATPIGATPQTMFAKTIAKQVIWSLIRC
jgi:hypothetical protein